LREIFATIKAEKGEQAVRELGGVVNDHRYARKKQKTRKKKASQPNGAQMSEAQANAALANGF
jgi:hypothetical protein